MGSQKLMSSGNIILKYIAYCTACLPPESVGHGYEDVLRYARFQLCCKTNRLMKDPIWDKYTDEEILIEHYAHNFAVDPDAKINFEQEYMQGDKSLDDWMIQEADKLEAFVPEDRVSYSPDNVGDD